jgi:hypothetical protein
MNHLNVKIILSQPIAMEQGKPIQISKKITCTTIPPMGKISRARSAWRALISLIACLVVIALLGYNTSHQKGHRYVAQHIVFHFTYEYL